MNPKAHALSTGNCGASYHLLQLTCFNSGNVTIPSLFCHETVKSPHYNCYIAHQRETHLFMNAEHTAQPTDHSPSAPDEQPLIFQFSKSTDQAVHSLINRNRMAMGAAFVGTAANFASGWKHENNMRMASSVLGIYANIVEMIFSGTRAASIGELTISHGDWEHHNGAMHTVMNGKLPEQAQNDISRLLSDASLPKSSVKVSYDRKAKKTTISIADNVFPELQQHLKEKLEMRQQVITAMMDSERHIELPNANGQPVVSGLKLDGFSVPQINTLREMLKNDFDIDNDLNVEGGQHQLKVELPDRDKFADILSPKLVGHEHHIRVRNGHEEETYAPGFIETLTRPDKHPKQHGILLGAIASNALRIGAGFQAETLPDGTKKTSPFESYSSIWSMMTYLIDYMPEPKQKNGDVVTGVQANYGPMEAVAHKVADTLNQRPLLTSAFVKGPTVAMRVKDAYSKDDPYKKVGAAMDALRAAITATIHKGDYGR